MNWEAIAAIGEIVGAIAVVATLIYLAIQIRTARISAASAATYSAMEGYSRWRANILQNSDIANAVAKANQYETLNEREQFQLRTLADELFILVAVGATETEKWGSINRQSVDLEYLKVVFEENPGLVQYWGRYRRIAATVSEEYVKAVDDFVIEIRRGKKQPPNKSLELDA